MGTGFRKRSCSYNKLKPNGDSKKSHHALVRLWPAALLLRLRLATRPTLGRLRLLRLLRRLRGPTTLPGGRRGGLLRLLRLRHRTRRPTDLWNRAYSAVTLAWHLPLIRAAGRNGA